MAARDSSSVDVPSVGLCEMSAEDERAVISLYQKCPALANDFKTISECVAAFGDSFFPTETLLEKLKEVVRLGILRAKDGQILDVCHFAIVTGFVDQAVTYYRRTLREVGKTYMTTFNPKTLSPKENSLNQIRSLFLSYSLHSVDVSRRLIQNGFVNDMVEDLNHVQHLSGEALDKGMVVLYSIGILDNFCQHSATEVAVREMGLIPVIIPFLHKSSKDVRSMTLKLLSHVASDEHMDLLRMDPGLVSYFMDNLTEAVAKKKRDIRMWTTGELLSTLVLVSRCDFNKKLLVALGTSKILKTVLSPRSERDEAEKQWSLKLYLKLSKDFDNRCIFKHDGHLFRLLDMLRKTDHFDTQKLAEKFFMKIHDERVDNNGMSDMPQVAALLTDQLNMLTILGVSPVHFVLDQLTTPQPQGAGPGDGKVRLLRALTELAQRGGHYRREVMATGGLTLLKDILHDGNDEDSGHVLTIVLALMSSEENLTIVKSQQEFTDLLRKAATKCVDRPEHSKSSTKVLSILEE